LIYNKKSYCIAGTAKNPSAHAGISLSLKGGKKKELENYSKNLKESR